MKRNQGLESDKKMLRRRLQILWFQLDDFTCPVPMRIEAFKLIGEMRPTPYDEPFD